MSSQLVQDVLNSYVQEIGTGAGKMLQAWTPVESELAEYAAALETENARLALLHEQAADELAEALYNLRLMTMQADTLHKRAKDAEDQLRKYQIVTVARRCTDSDRDCEGDGSGPGCENDVVWEIQAMDDDGSHYSYVCAEHLSNYQKWAHDVGHSPMVFELEDEDESNDN